MGSDLHDSSHSDFDSPIIMKLAILLLLPILSCICIKNPDFNVEYPSENKVLFLDKGRLINSMGFIHLAFKQDYAETIKELDGMIDQLKENYHKDMIKVQKSVAPISDLKSLEAIWDGPDFMRLIKERNQDSVFVIMSLMEVFMRYSKQLKGLFSSVPTGQQDSHPDNYLHTMTKRDLGFLLGGFAMFNSFRNSHRIDELESQLSSLSSSHNQMVDSVNMLTSGYNQLQISTKLILRLTNVLLQSNNRRLMAGAFNLADRLRDTVDRVVAIITSGQRRKVNPRLLDGEELIKIFKALQEKARNMNAEMILQEPTDLFEVEVSYAFDPLKYRFELVLHVPLILRSESLKLYEHVNFPLYESLGLNATIIPKVSESKFLAVLPKNSGTSQKDGIASHMYRVLDSAELQSCNRIRDVYLCGLRNTLKIDFESSCIGALWLQNNDLILKNCEMEILPPQEYVAKVGPREWLIMSHKPVSRTLQCGSNFVKPLLIENQTLLRLPENCNLQLSRYVLSTDINVHLDFKVDVMSWRFYGSVIKNLFREEMDPREIVQEVLKNRGQIELPDVTHLKHQFVPTSSIQFSKIWASIKNLSFFSGFSSLLVYAGCLWVIYFLISRGLLTRLLSLCRGPPTEIPMIIPARASIRRLPPAPRAQRAIAVETPPSYSSVMLEKQRAKAQDVELQPLAQFSRESTVSESESNLSESDCVVNGKRMKQNEFLCTVHDPEKGCSGFQTI